MTRSGQNEDGEQASSGIRVTFSGGETFFASVKGSEKLFVPEPLVLRCGLLADIRDQGDTNHQAVVIQLQISDAKAWLKCAKVVNSEELTREDDATLLGALKVSSPI